MEFCTYPPFASGTSDLNDKQNSFIREYRKYDCHWLSVIMLYYCSYTVLDTVL